MNRLVKPLPFVEFIGLIALLMATVAYSVDAMLPLLTPIGADLSPARPETAQLVITVFMIGLGLGTFVMGPVSDAFGRKTVILAGILLYMLAASMAALSTDMQMLLIARFIQGFGCAAPRVVSQALVRDLYSGRMMARVISLGMTVFTLFPAIAPFMGDLLGQIWSWRAIFWSFVIFGTASFAWLGLRQPETLSPENRRPLRVGPLWLALRTVLSHPRVRLYLLALTFQFSGMLIWISAIAPVFEQSFDRLDEFPSWFALAALVSAPASLINAKLVVRLGMRRIIGATLAALLVMVLVVLVSFGLELAFAGFWLFLAFMLLHFISIGFLIGNLNALALEPMGHVAGMAASVIGGVSTVVAALIASGVGLLVQGSPFNLALGILCCVLGAIAAMLMARRYAEVQTSEA